MCFMPEIFFPYVTYNSMQEIELAAEYEFAMMALIIYKSLPPKKSSSLTFGISLHCRLLILLLVTIVTW